MIDNEKERIIASEKQTKCESRSKSDEYDEEHKRSWKDVVRSVGLVVWNSETREFLGRTAKSWGR